ncbi:STAS domain-containing protein [Nonomuraea dietziae]|jgi:anti-sigma B factor antagonist|uniref:STAS domain-containing protein n=1 Tax=Nonomuraea dietziae TaxID=65515 RepID=UPI0033E5EDC2
MIIVSTRQPGLRAGARPLPADATVVRLHGDIDIFTSPALRDLLIHALDQSTGALVCDLTDVVFCDSSGLAVLVGMQRRARARGIDFGVASPRPYMVTLLHLTGLDRSLPLYGKATTLVPPPRRASI